MSSSSAVSPPVATPSETPAKKRKLASVEARPGKRSIIVLKQQNPENPDDHVSHKISLARNMTGVPHVQLAEYRALVFVQVEELDHNPDHKPIIPFMCAHHELHTVFAYTDYYGGGADMPNQPVVGELMRTIGNFFKGIKGIEVALQDAPSMFHY